MCVVTRLLPSALRSGGAIVDTVAFYRNVAAQDVADIARDVRREVFDVVVFTSPSTAERLFEGATQADIAIGDALRRVKVVAIGEITARALREVGITVGAVAARPSDDGIVEAVRGLF